MKNIFLVLLLLAFTASGFAQNIDQSKSKVDFKIGSIMWAKVKGEITNMDGTVNFNEDDLSKSSFNVSVDVKTIDTDNEKRDEHLKNEDFFETEKYPFISFKSSEITKTDDGYVTYGKLTIKDVTKDVSIPFSVQKTGRSKTLVGEFEITRLDYTVGVDQSNMLVDKKVKMTITCVVK